MSFVFSTVFFFLALETAPLPSSCVEKLSQTVSAKNKLQGFFRIVAQNCPKEFPPLAQAAREAQTTRFVQQSALLAQAAFSVLPASCRELDSGSTCNVPEFLQLAPHVRRDLPLGHYAFALALFQEINRRELLPSRAEPRALLDFLLAAALAGEKRRSQRPLIQ